VASTPERVRIHYHRPPDREEVFEQRVIAWTPDCVVTLLERARLDRPMRIDGAVALEHGAPIVWFTFPGVWHDIGRFHTADGTPTGLYANVLAPVEFVAPDRWRTTDLFLDVWLDAAGRLHVLDEDELDAALRAGWIDEATAAAARAEAERIRADALAGTWPPPIVEDWPLERALRGNARD
jgi:predicted RNA-binding protein associated with RNAse of E/G family